MKNSAKKIILSMVLGLFPISVVHAFFPFPVPLIGTDIPNNSTDLDENINAIGKQAEQVKATYEKTVEELKSGSFGFDAIKNYKSTLESIDVSRLVPEIKLPAGLSKNINDSDKAAEAVEGTYLNTYSQEGNHMEQAKQNRQKQIELLQMNVAAMYAHALATRVNLAKERDLPEATLESENTREIIQANRAMEEKIVKRWNDILFMEAQIAEYKSTQILTSISLDSQTSAERDVTPTTGDKK